MHCSFTLKTVSFGFLLITRRLSQGQIVILLLDTFPRLQTVFSCLRLLEQQELCPVQRNEQALYCEPGLAMTNNKEEIDNADQGEFNQGLENQRCIS